MRKRPLMWLLVSMGCFVGAIYFWRYGDRMEAQRKAMLAGGAGSVAAQGPRLGVVKESVESAGTSPGTILGTQVSSNSAASIAAGERSRYRLSNMGKSAGALGRSERGILLENALIDTTRPWAPQIPEKLRSVGEPGTYIVQAPGLIDDAFREALKSVGAEVISYIPNNAYLVRASGSQLAGMGKAAGSVIAYEPYYKLSPELLGQVLDGTSVGSKVRLNVVVYADSAGRTQEALGAMGAEVSAQGLSPFGPLLSLETVAENVAAIARLEGVQVVEKAHKRKVANDLSRARVGVATDTQTTVNYMGLAGTKVVVQVNDTGVDATHPALAARVIADSRFPFSLTDTDGHGTHVAGIIAGNGSGSITVTNAIGSFMPGVARQFRGMASAAKVFVEPILFASPFQYLSDFELQETAGRTNALISNNGWNYDGNEYDINAASFDAAVRDTLPEVTGSQPVVFVFSAGNAGNGDEDGTGISGDSILSPATAKNVITVGALEQPRDVTNEVVKLQETNAFWALGTDSQNQVASFSSRGNVGVGVEGDFGRYKPDVVAPGVFVVSTRSGQWDKNAYYNPTNYHINTFIDRVGPGLLHGYPFTMPYNTVNVPGRSELIQAFAIFQQLDVPIYVRFSNFAPTTNVFDLIATNQIVLTGSGFPTNWSYGIKNPTDVTFQYQVLTEYATTNDEGNMLTVFSNMNETIGTPGPNGPLYRYESGTSMSAANVSGVLALMEDFFTNQFQVRPSPALLKAMLINGARSVNLSYDFQVAKELNDEGWGVINLTNSVPKGLFNGYTNLAALPVLLFDQSTNNSLATGDSRTMRINVTDAARNSPLRFTLVWTDPPGNPAVGIKLVNDLDLIVTNESTGQVYWGNDIPNQSTVNFPSDTNSPNRDFVNNVENVFLNNGQGSNYWVTVVGRRVNVNAVTSQTNNVVQDYALVISSGDGAITNCLTVDTTFKTISRGTNFSFLTVITNDFVGVSDTIGQLLLEQRVGANSPLLGTNTVSLGTNTTWGAGGSNGVITVGQTNQWRFYVLTNSTDVTFTNAAFAVFLGDDLASSRMGVTNVQHPERATRAEADIDMYVSTDPGLTNLSLTAIQAADKAVGRGGTEVIVYTNAVAGQTYYVAVKSEDQQGAEFGFFGAFSQLPFSTDDNGSEIVRGINVPSVIPDNSPLHPKPARIMGIAIRPMTVRHVVVTNIITHERFGDLVGSLRHDRISAVLNNHTQGITNIVTRYIYEDGELATANNFLIGGVPYSIARTDGPGHLTDFMGSKGFGLWMLTEVDNALTHTGAVNSLFIRLDPQIADGNGVRFTIAPHSFAYDFVDVPPEATNLTINVTNFSGSPRQVILYVRRGALPTQGNYQYFKVINPPGDSLSISTTDLPPLQPGRYFIGIFNPNDIDQTVELSWKLGLSLTPVPPIIYASGGATPIADDAVSYSSITINDPADLQVERINVAVSMTHPRLSDVALTLISPTGKRFVLMENRGGPTATNMDITFSENTNFTQIPIKFAPLPFATTNTAINSFDAVAPGDFVAPAAVDGWSVDSNQVSVVNDAANALSPNQFLALGGGTISRNLATVPGIQYKLKFGYRGPGINAFWHLDGNAVDVINGNLGGYVGAPATVQGEVGAALSFNGISDYVIVPPSATLNVGPAGGMTIDAWIRPVNFAVEQPIVEWNNGSTIYAHFWISVLSPGSLYANLVDITGAGHSLSSAANVLTLNVWQHVAMTYSRATGLATLYRNGQAVAQQNLGNFIPNTTPNLYLGYRASGVDANRHYQGAQDEVSLYSRALSASELRAIYLAGTSGKFDPAVATPQNLAKARVTATGANPQVLFGNNFLWGNAQVPLATGPGGTRVQIDGLEPGMLLDAFSLGQTLDYFPEEPLDPLLGDRPQGTWTLEIRDGRAGDPPGTLNSWQLEFNFATNSPGATTLTDGVAVTNTVFGCGIVPFTVDVPAQARYATNILITSTAPVNVWFNQTNPVTANPFTDIEMLTGQTSQSFTLFTNGSPPLIPGARYYLGVENANCTTNVTFSFQVDFGLDVITLTNMVPYTNNNAGPALPNDYYHFVIPTNAARAQFEIDNPSGDMDLVVRKGLPLPDFSSFDYLSANPGVNDELIVVVTNSTPIPLSAGNWYLTAINQSGAPVTYSVIASWWTTTGQPITITGAFMSGTNSFCITWTSLPGVHYFIQGVPSLTTNMVWATVVPDILGDPSPATNTTYCIALPSPYHFFRVVEGIPLVAPPPVLNVSHSAGGFLLQWTGPTWARYRVEWTSSLSLPWNQIPGLITSNTGQFSYLDDGSQTAPFGPARFYRVVVVP